MFFTRVHHPYFRAPGLCLGCKNKLLFFRCKQDIRATFRSLDWVQALKKVLNPQYDYEGSIRVFPAGSRMQYRIDAADIWRPNGLAWLGYSS